MQIKIQTKMLALIIVVIICTFIIMLFLSRMAGERTAELLTNARTEKSIFLERILTLKSKSLESFTRDYTFWDDMVHFVRTRDRIWPQQNIETGLVTFNTQAVWIYDTDFSLVYSSNTFAPGDLQHLPVPTRRYNRIVSGNQLAHFFIVLPDGLMEVFGATIHPTSDPGRKTPDCGYFFAGRLWNEAYLRDISNLTDCTLSIQPGTGEAACAALPVNGADGKVFFTKKLPAWDGSGAACLHVTAVVPLIPFIHNSLRKGFWHLLLFSSTVLILLACAIFFWISKPLNSITQSLHTQMPEPINNLLANQTEMGHIARLIKNFFEQKAELNREIIARRQAQDELLKAQNILERRVQERTAALSAANATLEEEIKAHTDTEREKEKLHTWMVQCAKLAALGELGSSLAHEIKNPVGIIMGYTGVILDGLDEKDPNYLPVKAIEKEAQRCRDFLNNLLSYARTAKLEREYYDLNKAIERAMPLIEVKAKFKYITVVQECDTQLPGILMNTNNIQQMILNLCDNGIDAMSNGGTLNIRTKSTAHNGGNYIELQVQDTGCGIPKNVQLKIFEPFFTTKPEGKGTGLGLSLVYDIVQKHEGIINLESTEGQGTLFRVLLPTAPPQLT